MSDLKDDFFESMGVITRPGAEQLAEWLEETDFFEAPASTNFHGAYPGGLVLHSMSVCDSMVAVVETFDYGEKFSAETIAICGLLHDVCKIGMYVRDERMATNAQLKYLKDLLAKASMEMPPEEQQEMGYIGKLIDWLSNGQKGDCPDYSYSYKVKDEFPFGHGEKSVYLINKFMDLTDEEALAIRWHLGSFDPGVHFGYPSGYPFKQVIKEHPLVTIMCSSDFMTSWLVDNRKD
jgi:hypothetical protein